MDLITIVLTLIIAGFVLWLVNKIPMHPTVGKIINVTVIVFILIWLFKIFGILSYLSNIKI